VQFHHLIRTIPGNGLIISNQDDVNLPEVLQRGCWTPIENFAQASQHDWSANALADDYHRFEVYLNNERQGVVDWPLIGEHNMLNALAAIAAARHAGVPAEFAIESLGGFAGIKRRMEVRGEVNGVTVYDDFAHHPTAIATTLAGLRKAVGDAPIVAILEPRSNTMRMGVHTTQLAAALKAADRVMLYKPDEIDWDMTAIVESLNGKAQQFNNTARLSMQLFSMPLQGAIYWS